MDGGAAIHAHGLSHVYRTAGGLLSVLDMVDLDVPAGSYATLQGASGAGKTTLLALIGGLDRPQGGDLRVGGHDLAGLSGDDLAHYRRSTIGFVFQHFGLLPTMSALENVELAAILAGSERRARRRQAQELLDAVGLAERAGHRPAELSGGERQRVGLARALVNEPAVLLADEPTGNLDEETGAHMIDLLEATHRRLGFTLLVVTHNRALAGRASLRLRLDQGRVHAA